ncbi:MAG: GNAT family N-acetyltransferase [Chloroflexia bacterium]|nr:GNAT family N-acetyltransferase [Chloroflexia bacterium]
MDIKVNDFLISDNKAHLSIPTIHKYLSEDSYWAKGRPYNIVARSIENSMCIGAFTRVRNQAGFARVVTDLSTTYYICDLFVLPEYQGNGLGKAMVEFIIKHPSLKSLSGLLLTADAHGLYEKYGFENSEEVQRKFMMKPRVSSSIDL